MLKKTKNVEYTQNNFEKIFWVGGYGGGVSKVGLIYHQYPVPLHKPPGVELVRGPRSCGLIKRVSVSRDPFWGRSWLRWLRGSGLCGSRALWGLHVELPLKLQKLHVFWYVLVDLLKKYVQIMYDHGIGCNYSSTESLSYCSYSIGFSNPLRLWDDSRTRMEWTHQTRRTHVNACHCW